MVLYFFTMQCAEGYVADVPINHTNLKTDFSFLKIKALHIHRTNDEYIVFIVSVIPTKHQASSHFEGILYISSTNDFVAQASVQAGKVSDERLLKDVPERLKSKCVMFEFGVSAKYLTKSQFTVEETTSPLPASATAYEISLKDFANDE